MSKQWKSIVLLASIVMIAGVAGAQQFSTKDDTYTWHAEFVSLDATAKTMTVSRPAVTSTRIWCSQPSSFRPKPLISTSRFV